MPQDIPSLLLISETEHLYNMCTMDCICTIQVSLMRASERLS